MFESDYNTLNTHQKQVVQTLDENLLVLAPAGTGKTKVIAMRTANLIHKGIEPGQILCLTFTNKAAREMKDRVYNYIKGTHQDVVIKTFHSFCYHVICCEKKFSHFTFPCTIIDESDMEEIIQQIILEVVPKDLIAKINVKQILTLIENIKKYSLNFKIDERYDYEKVINSYHANELNSNYNRVPQEIARHLLNIFTVYQSYLKENNIIDFTDLIVEVHYLLDQEEILKRWNAKYRYLQIDEMQDTSIREYNIIKKLGLGNNMSMFGDFNQTIYEWRGSKPKLITEDFKKSFKAKEIFLNINYRSTQMLLEAANEFINTTNLKPINCRPTGVEVGEKISILKGESETHELELIANSIAQARNTKESIAVLTRTNTFAKKVCVHLLQRGIECVQVEDIKLFRRKEIKDILAYFAYAINPRNTNALQKICLSPYVNMDIWLLKNLNSTKDVHMYLHDWFNHYAIDSYAPLFKAFSDNDIIVLDVESTGLNTVSDDIIQIAAIKYGKNGVLDQLDILVKPTKKVGDSFYVHGFSDEQLSKEGLEPKEALKILLDFTKDSVIVGHNINYDMQIINSSLERYGFLPIRNACIYDTLDLAYKVYPQLENHKLSTLSDLIKTKTLPTHNAMNDILATAEILMHFIEKIKQKDAKRLEKIEEIYSYIQEYKEKIMMVTRYIQSHSTTESIAYIMNELGFKNCYTANQVKSIRQMYRIADKLYNSNLSIHDNIIQLLEFASLHYSELEQSALFKNKIPVITIHQSKGLEFDIVYISGCSQNIFPSKRSEGEGKLSEELRLFYVAMTRAKTKLYVTCDNSKGESILVKSIGENYKSYMQVK